MKKDQYGKWAVGNGYGGGTKTGTYEEYCNDTWAGKGEFVPCEKEEKKTKQNIGEKKLKI